MRAAFARAASCSTSSAIGWKSGTTHSAYRLQQESQGGIAGPLPGNFVWMALSSHLHFTRTLEQISSLEDVVQFPPTLDVTAPPTQVYQVHTTPKHYAKWAS